MKKLKSVILAISLLFSGISIILSNNNYQKTAASDLSNFKNLGSITISGVKGYDPVFASDNYNAFLWLKLDGSDYIDVDGTSAIEKAKSALPIELNVKDKMALYDKNDKVIDHDYWEIYANQCTYHPYLSIGVNYLAKASKVIINEGLIIPSYSLITGNTNSETYGYYTLKGTYEATFLGNSRQANTVVDWSIKELSPKEVTIKKVVTYVDVNCESLAFTLDGFGVDYPDVDGQGGFTFDPSIYNDIVPNITSKLHLYDKDEEEIKVQVNAIFINLWMTHPNVAISFINLKDVKKISIEKGLILPSYARYKDNLSSAVYDGFAITENYTYVLNSDDVHGVAGAFNNWTYISNLKDLGSLTIKNVYTENPFGNLNEFVTIEFNEETDFLGAAYTKWDADKYALLTNIVNHLEIYKADDTLLSNKIIDAYYHFYYDNSISIMIDGCGSGVKIVIKDGFIVPSLANYSDDTKSKTYGNYTIRGDYEYLIPSNASHGAGDKNIWLLPSCNIEYYDENNNLISNYSTSATCGKEYTLKDPIIKDGYKASWTIVEPESLTIENNAIVVPNKPTTIKFKLAYEEIQCCSLNYYDENDILIEEYSSIKVCGSEYYLEPVISKIGYDAKWVINNPSTLEIIDNKITLPEETTTINIKISYSIRSYTLSFNSESTNSLKVTYGEKIGNLPSVPEEEGKTGNWYIGEDLITSETVWKYDESQVAEAIYVDKVLKVSFDSIGGNNIDDIEIIYGSKVNDLPTPIKDKSYFDGWYIDNSYSTIFNKNTIVTDDIKLFAKWLDKYTVTFDTDGGSLISSIDVISGNAIDIEFNPTKEGYEFIGWTLNGVDFDLTSPINDNITLIAEWKNIKTTDSGSGCNGSLISSSLLISIISLTAFVVVVKKKEN